MRALIFVYIIEEFALTHKQNAPLEWFSSTPGLGSNRAEAVGQDLLVANPVIEFVL